MRKTKSKIIILLLLFPMIFSVGLFTLNANAGPSIPEDSPNNSWHWGVNTGDMLIFETEIIGTNFFTLEVTMVRNFDIFNITSIINETGDSLSLYPNQNFSKVMADQLYEDSVGSLSPSPLPNEPIASFGYNDTLSKEFYQPKPYSLAPMILPLNNTDLDVSLMAPILNETYVNPMGEQGFFNKFDNYTYDVGKTEIYFQNTTDNYYFRASYYPNNGTLKDLDAYYLIWMGTWVSFNITSKRVFNFDGTDEVMWGVSPGETYYYYINQSGSAFLAKLEVEGINKAVYWSKNWTAYNTLWPMVFEEVVLSISTWNGTGWEPVMVSMPYTAANNFYPMCFPLMESMMQTGFFLPTSATLDDLMFMFNNHTADLTKWFPFDTIYYNVSGNILNMTLTQSGNGLVSYAVYNLDTGFVDLNTAYYLGNLTSWFEKADELVEWDVDIGDTLYFKQIIDGDIEERRFIIDSIEYKFLDVTTIGFPIPTGQPKYQFFTEVYANFSVWMKDTETWFDPGGTWVFSAANEYWPIAPYHMMGNMPYLLPEGTVANDLQNLFNIFSMWYDDITYNPGHVIMRNTTASKELHFYFDETTGRMTYLGGENYAMNEWWLMSVYPEFIQNLNTGANTFVLSDNYDMDPTLTVDIDITGSTEPDFIYAVLPHNPIGIPLPNGTALLYLDHKITDHSAVVGNVTMTLQFPSSIQISENFIYLYAFNVSGTGEWDLAPPEYYLYGVAYDLANNRMTFEIQIAGPYMYISAISYEATDGDGAPEIPGYDLFFLSLAIITISALLIKKMRKKK